MLHTMGRGNVFTGFGWEDLVVGVRITLS